MFEVRGFCVFLAYYLQGGRGVVNKAIDMGLYGEVAIGGF